MDKFKFLITTAVILSAVNGAPTTIPIVQHPGLTSPQPQPLSVSASPSSPHPPIARTTHKIDTYIRQQRHRHFWTFRSTPHPTLRSALSNQISPLQAPRLTLANLLLSLLLRTTSTFTILAFLLPPPRSAFVLPSSKCQNCKNRKS